MTTDGGATWTTQTVVPPSAPGYEEIGDQLNAISCVTSTDCVAVGLAYDAGIPLPPLPVNYVQQAVFETSTDGGQTWQGQLGPVGPQSTGCCGATSGDNLTGLSCPKAQDCIAVGTDSAFQVTLDPAVGWTTSRLSSQLGNAPPFAQAISCSTALDCIAVGDAANNNVYDTPVVVTTDGGTTWSSQATNPADAALSGVACVSSKECWAVGSTSRGSLILVTSDGGQADPTVSGVSPNQGPSGGGTLVTIAGSGFSEGTPSVFFGPAAATHVTVISDSQLTALSPPSYTPVPSTGLFTDVTVANGLGTSPLVMGDQFNYFGQFGVSPQGGGADTTPSASASVTISPGPTVDLLVASVATYNGATVSVSGGGLAWTRALDQADSITGDGGRVSVWDALFTPGSLTDAVTTTSVVTGNGGWAQTLDVEAYSGAAGIGATAFASGTSASPPSLAITPQQSGSLVSVAGFDADSTTTVTPGPAQTLDGSYQDNTEDAQMWFQHYTGAVTASQAITVGDTLAPAGRWDLGAVEIVPD